MYLWGFKAHLWMMMISMTLTVMLVIVKMTVTVTVTFGAQKSLAFANLYALWQNVMGQLGRWGTEKHRQLIRFIHNTWPAGNVVNIVDVCDQCKTICWENMILEHVFQIWSSQFSFPRSLECEFLKTLPLIATLKIMRKKTWVYVVAGAAVIVIFILVVVDVGIKN